MNPPAPGMPGTLFVVATPIGNLEDITLRALRVLKDVQVVAAEDTRRTGLLLQHFEIRTPLVSLHEHNERARTRSLVARLAAGESVALVSDAGTPLISDPGFLLVHQAIEAGIDVVAVPGASALTAALSVSGLAVDRFTFAGFPPARSAERRRWLRTLAAVPGTMAFFEAPHRIKAVLTDMLAELGDRWAVLARELTKMHEATSRGWLSDLVAGPVAERGEYVILLSDQKNTSTVVETEGIEASALPSMEQEFGRMTKNDGLSPRDAVRQLAASYGTPKKRVYDRLRAQGLLGHKT